MTSTILKCNFFTCHLGYACQVKDQEIPADTKLEFIGDHVHGRNNNGVKYIEFNGCSISKVPQKLTETFPNLNKMSITGSGLEEVSRSDLVEYKKFMAVYFTKNEIGELPGDLFDDFEKLEYVSFDGNPLTTVEPNILNGHEHLKHINFNGTATVHGSVESDVALSSNDEKLVELKENLVEFFMVPYANMKTENEVLWEKLFQLTKLKTFIQSDEAFRDFYVNIDGEKYHVHKLLLAARSPTLAEMLKKNPDAEDLNLVDISPDLSENILNFIYTDEVPQNADFMQLFAAAGRLKIDELMNYAAKKVLEHLNAENAVEVLNLGIKFKHNEMKQKAFEEIKRKHSGIEFKDEWIDEDGKIEKVVEYFLKIRAIEKEFVDMMKK